MVGFQRRHIDNGNPFLLGDLADIAGIAHIALDFAVGPDVADRQSKQHRVDAFSFGLVDRFTDVPAIGVDGFGLSGEWTGGLWHVLRFVADAFECAAWLGAAEVSAIVVAHLQQQIVSGFHLGQHLGPMAFIDIGAGAASCDGTIGHVDARGIEECCEVVSPAKIGAVAGG